jgi:hypothetical protein
MLEWHAILDSIPGSHPVPGGTLAVWHLGQGAECQRLCVTFRGFKMENNLAHYILMIAGIGLLVFVLTRVGHYYWSYRLNRWAAEQGFTLIKFRGAKFYEGPSAWLRSDSQSLFRVQVENKRWEKVNGWVMFGTYWGFTLGEPVTQVVWDDREV